MADPALRRMSEADLRTRANTMQRLASEAQRQASACQRAAAAARRELRRRAKARGEVLVDG